MIFATTASYVAKKNYYYYKAKKSIISNTANENSWLQYFSGVF